MPGAAATHSVVPAASRNTPKSRRRIQVAVDVVAGDVGDRNVAEVVAHVHPRRRAGDRVVGHLEHVPRRRGRRGVEARVRDPGVVRVGRIDVDAADEAVRIVRRQAIEARERRRRSPDRRWRSSR